MASVTFRGVSKQFGRNNPVLQSVDLEVHAGEFLVLVGPNGSGKSTLLRLAAGLDRPSAGEILLDGQSVSGIAAHQRNLALVFQGESLYPQMTVYQNLAFGLRGRNPIGSLADVLRKWIPWKGSLGVPLTETDHQVRQAAKWLGIESMLSRWPNQLSGGERQRVAFGREVVRNPAAFLLDEPLSSLDPHLRRRLADDFREIQRRMRATTIMVTHDAGQALSLADRIAVLREGELVQVGTPEEVYHQPTDRFVADLLGRTDLNTLSGELCGSAIERVFRSSAGDIRLVGNMPIPPGGGKMTLAFRAEDLLLEPLVGKVNAGEKKTDLFPHVRLQLLPCLVKSVSFCGAEHQVLLHTGDSNTPEYDRISWRSILSEVPLRESDNIERESNWLHPGAAVRTSVAIRRCFWLDVNTGKNLLKDV